MIIFRHPNIDERTSELNTEQALARRKRDREYVIFEGGLFAWNEATSSQGPRMNPVHAAIGQARTLRVP